MQTGGDAKSLQQKVQEARRRVQARTRYWVPIPETEGLLVGRYKPVDWERQLELEKAVAGQDEKQRMFNGSADYLLAACDGVEAVDEDGRKDLGVTLGLSLAKWLDLNLEGVTSDRQALILTIADGEKLLMHAAAVRLEQRSEDRGADETIVGESGAAS